MKFKFKYRQRRLDIRLQHSETRQRHNPTHCFRNIVFQAPNEPQVQGLWHQKSPGCIQLYFAAWPLLSQTLLESGTFCSSVKSLFDSLFSDKTENFIFYNYK